MTDGGSNGKRISLVGHGGSGPGFELMVLVSTENWKSDFEYSTSEFVQSEAIKRLRANLKAI